MHFLPVAIWPDLCKIGHHTSLLIMKFFCIRQVEEVEFFVDGNCWVLELLICGMSFLNRYFLDRRIKEKERRLMAKSWATSQVILMVKGWARPQVILMVKGWARPQVILMVKSWAMSQVILYNTHGEELG